MTSKNIPSTVGYAALPGHPSDPSQYAAHLLYLGARILAKPKTEVKFSVWLFMYTSLTSLPALESKSPPWRCGRATWRREVRLSAVRRKGGSGLPEGPRNVSFCTGGRVGAGTWFPSGLLDSHSRGATQREILSVKLLRKANQFTCRQVEVSFHFKVSCYHSWVWSAQHPSVVGGVVVIASTF